LTRPFLLAALDVLGFHPPVAEIPTAICSAAQESPIALEETDRPICLTSVSILLKWSSILFTD
jgi:hypothetical protein